MSDQPTPQVVTPGTFKVLGADQYVGKVKFAGANATGRTSQWN
jgi:hypothetical protein